MRLRFGDVAGVRLTDSKALEFPAWGFGFRVQVSGSGITCTWAVPRIPALTPEGTGQRLGRAICGSRFP